MRKLFSSNEKLFKIALISVGVSIALLIGEIGLRVVFSNDADYYIWPPKLTRYFYPDPSIMPGVEGRARFIVNSAGMRGEELSGEYTYKILTIGGSTTELDYLDQDETWQGLIQKRLNGSADNHMLWIGNVGRNGASTRHHIVHMKYLLEQYPDIDAVMMLIGINDLLWRLSQDKDYNPDFLKQADYEEQLLPLAFSFFPLARKEYLPFYKRTAIWHMGKRLKYLILSLGLVQDEKGLVYEKWRENRRNALAIRRTLPDLTSALEEYSKNINTIIDIAEDKSVRIIFMTQPVLWKQGLSKELEDLLWLVGVGEFQKRATEYYSVEALADAMDMYNKALLDVCQQRQVEYIDLASVIPKDGTVFYDDCHFNENGCRMVAAVLANYLLEHEPFSR